MKTVRRIVIPAVLLISAAGLWSLWRSSVPVGDWNPTQEKTSSGWLVEVNLEAGTFTLRDVEGCAKADGNDVDGVVVFGLSDRRDLEKLRAEFPLESQIVVEHERVEGLVSDAGQLKCLNYRGPET